VLAGVHSSVTDPDGDDILGEYGQSNLSTVLTDDVRGWISQTTPEPGSAMLLVGGSLMLITRRRRCSVHAL
jgi:hypothetical protein